MKRRFEEILEECLAAHLEGRRSVEESLSLYPALAPDLEPLLRTAADVSYAFEALNPPSYIQERGRLRFVAAASERRRAREIANGVWGFNRSRAPWNFRHWGLLGSGIAAAAALLIAGGILFLGDGGGGRGPQGAGNLGTPSPAAGQADFVANFETFKDTLDRIREKARRGEVSPSDIAELRNVTSLLGESGQLADPAKKKEVEQALTDQLVLATQLSESPPPGTEDELQELASVTQKAANDLGIELPAPSPSPEPAATDTPTPDPVSSATPAPTPRTETPAPTPAPTPTATPSLQGVE